MGVRSCNNCCAMGRRLGEATKACRTRRTRGERGLRFFLELGEGEADVFLLAGGRLAGGALFAGALLTGALLAGALLGEEDKLDWAAAGGKKPRQGRKKNPAKTTTSKRRTQNLPSIRSSHPCLKDRLQRHF